MHTPLLEFTGKNCFAFFLDRKRLANGRFPVDNVVDLTGWQLSHACDCFLEDLCLKRW